MFSVAPIESSMSSLIVDVYQLNQPGTDRHTILPSKLNIERWWFWRRDLAVILQLHLGRHKVWTRWRVNVWRWYRDFPDLESNKQPKTTPNGGEILSSPSHVCGRAGSWRCKYFFIDVSSCRSTWKKQNQFSEMAWRTHEEMLNNLCPNSRALHSLNVPPSRTSNSSKTNPI